MLSQAEENDARINEAEEGVNLAIAAREKPTAKKQAPRLEVENPISRAIDTSVRLAESAEELTAPQGTLTESPIRKAEVQDSEQSLVMEIEHVVPCEQWRHRRA